MSTYILKNSKDGVYVYDFQLKGQRFSGSTGKTRKREADAVEAEIKAAEKKRLSERADWAAPRLTIEQACERWWEEKQLDWTPSTHKTLLRNLAWVVDYFGRSKMLDEIDDNAVALMVAKRRGERVPNRPNDLVSNRTVNCSAIEPLQRVMVRAELVWKNQLQKINWSMHRLKEKGERVREASAGEQIAIFDEAARGYDDVIQFSIRTGARRNEAVFLRWTQVDFFSNRITLLGKGDKERIIPMSSDVRDLLWSLKDNHPVFVFTYVASGSYTVRERGGPKKIIRGQRYPVTPTGFTSQWQRIKDRAEVTDFRFHDTRHTAATRLLRGSGNLRLVQKMLGHADIKTTTKYAHVTMDDLALAMEGVGAGEPRRGEKSHESPIKTRRQAAND